MDLNKVNNGQRMDFANSPAPIVALDILSRLLRSKGWQQIAGSSEYATVVNAVTVDVETALLNNFINEIEEIKKGKTYEENQ